MRFLRNESGSAVVTAMLVTMMLFGVGMTTMSLVDNQSRDTGRERKRESSFALSEGVLNTQIFLLSREWPASSATQYPPSCSKLTETDRRCPSEIALVKTFQGADYGRGITWTTEVHDNTAGAAADFYDDALVRQQPTWDANGDTYMWVRARGVLPQGVNRDGTVKLGASRTLVALVKAELLALNFPRAAVIAGSLDITQNGNHNYIDTDGSTGTESGSVILRCPDVNNDSCANWTTGSGIPQVGPQTPTSNTGQQSALGPDTVERLRETARAQGRYYAVGTANGPCPPNTQAGLTNPGGVIFIENATGCAFNPPGGTSIQYNSPTNPGVLVVGSGAFEISGNAVYNGLIYHVNASDGYPGNVPMSGDPPAVKLSGGAVVNGAVIIDGNGQIEIGNNNGANQVNGNIIYNPNVFSSMRAYGTAGIVQNSFRELPGANAS